MLFNKEALIRVPVSQNDCRIRFMLRCNSAKRFCFFLYANAKQMQAIITDTEANPHRPPPINTIEQARPTNALRHGWDSIVQPRQTQTPAINAYVIPKPVIHAEPADCDKMLAASIAINAAEPKTMYFDLLTKSVASSSSACKTIDLQYRNFHWASLSRSKGNPQQSQTDTSEPDST